MERRIRSATRCLKATRGNWCRHSMGAPNPPHETGSHQCGHHNRSARLRNRAGSISKSIVSEGAPHCPVSDIRRIITDICIYSIAPSIDKGILRQNGACRKIPRSIRQNRRDARIPGTVSAVPSHHIGVGRITVDGRNGIIRWRSSKQHSGYLKRRVDCRTCVPIRPLIHLPLPHENQGGLRGSCTTDKSTAKGCHATLDFFHTIQLTVRN